MQRYDDVHMATAALYATKSKAIRLKVGAVLVTNNGVIIPGYNGTPTGTDNACEYTTSTGLVTKDSVIHAELNCIIKAAREGIQVAGASLYVTACPCLRCAALIVQSGITRVVYGEEWTAGGKDYLHTNGVNLLQYVK